MSRAATAREFRDPFGGDILSETRERDIATHEYERHTGAVMSGKRERDIATHEYANVTAVPS
jgi:hypothetical protein